MFIREDFKISYSRISAYLFCPFKYKLVYVDNLYASATPDISFGHSIHATLERFHHLKSRRLEDLLECYEDVWDNEGFKDIQTSYDYYVRGKKMLECYLDEFLKSPAKIVGIEKRFDANIGKYRFCGIIDRIDQHPDGSYEIIDYKTHPVAWDQVAVDEDIQLSFYAYASKSVFGIRPDKIAIHFIACAKKVYTTRTAEQMREAIDMAIDAAVKIRNDEFPALPQKCPVCTFVDKCPRSVAAQP